MSLQPVITWKCGPILVVTCGTTWMTIHRHNEELLRLRGHDSLAGAGAVIEGCLDAFRNGQPFFKKFPGSELKMRCNAVLLELIAPPYVHAVNRQPLLDILRWLNPERSTTPRTTRLDRRPDGWLLLELVSPGTDTGPKILLSPADARELQRLLLQAAERQGSTQEGNAPEDLAQLVGSGQLTLSAKSPWHSELYWDQLGKHPHCIDLNRSEAARLAMEIERRLGKPDGRARRTKEKNA